MLTLKMPLFMLLLFDNRIVFQEWVESGFVYLLYIYFLGRCSYLEYICLYLALSDFAVVMATGEPEVCEGRL